MRATCSAAFVSTRGRAKPPNPDAVFEPFSYGAVQLLDGPIKHQFDQNHSFFLNLSEDRLLKIYRQRVGLPAPGDEMGGWYDDFCPGAHFGQYVSALARFAAATGSEPTRAKVRRLVAGYAETVDATGKFFADLRYPAYTYDKLVLGLIDAHSYAGDRSALNVLYATTRAATPHMADHALTQEERENQRVKDETYKWDETYTLAENLFLASDRTGDRMFGDLAKRYLLDRTFFDPLSENENVLPGRHAYSHMNALSSGMQGYLKLHDPKYLAAVTNAVDMIWKDQSYATGGWGPNEAFVQPGRGKLGASLSETHRSFETPCGAYAHIKLMRYLLALTGDARYGDSMERVLLNTVLGALPIQPDGRCFYYSDYAHSAKKTYRLPIADSPYGWDHDARWGCCSGTLPQAAADYVVDGYFRAKDGIAVNLYYPSRIIWDQADARCTITQDTHYPTEDLVTLRVEPSRETEFTIHLRIPMWTGNRTSVSVNGKRVTTAPQPGTFFTVHRRWRKGDRIELEIHQVTRTEPVDEQTLDQVAVLRGACVLCAIAPEQPTVRRDQLSKLKIARANGDAWNLQSEESGLLLRPFISLGRETYQTYLKVRG
jgi:hypothetical protein